MTALITLCAVLAAGDARPTVAITPPSTAAGESWLGMALADNLTNRLLIHSRFDPKNLERVYPLNVFSWRQSLSAARSEGVSTTKIGKAEADAIRAQLG